MEKVKGEKGKFFSVSAGAVRTISLKTNWAEAVLAYLVLAKHKKGKTIWSTGGAPATATALAVSRHRADQLIDELKKVTLDESRALQAVMSPEVWNELTGGTPRYGRGHIPLKFFPAYRRRADLPPEPTS